MPTLKKLIILDRDGVINEDSEHFIKSPDEWHAIPNSLEAIALLNQAGYRVVIATNQSGIGRGLFTMETLNAIHLKMQAEAIKLGAHISAIFFCPHTAEDHCQCRKPLPGMLNTIMERFSIEPQETHFVGDSLRDIQAGQAAHIHTYLVLTGKGEKTLSSGQLPPNIIAYENLYAFVLSFLSAESL